MKKNGLEKKLVKFTEEVKKNLKEEKEIKSNMLLWLKTHDTILADMRVLLREQEKLGKELARQWQEHEKWLKDHNVRLGLHWEEIRHK
ncbi:MAG TPA: hypothetical protein DCX95_01690 [Elusimicrobia bacterium]|nr:hypothetical protein [Elusimicrobiota bacterium]